MSTKTITLGYIKEMGYRILPYDREKSTKGVMYMVFCPKELATVHFGTNSVLLGSMFNPFCGCVRKKHNNLVWVNCHLDKDKYEDDDNTVIKDMETFYNLSRNLLKECNDLSIPIDCCNILNNKVFNVDSAYHSFMRYCLGVKPTKVKDGFTYFYDFPSFSIYNEINAHNDKFKIIFRTKANRDSEGYVFCKEFDEVVPMLSFVKSTIQTYICLSIADNFPTMLKCSETTDISDKSIFNDVSVVMNDSTFLKPDVKWLKSVLVERLENALKTLKS